MSSEHQRFATECASWPRASTFSFYIRGLRASLRWEGIRRTLVHHIIISESQDDRFCYQSMQDRTRVSVTVNSEFRYNNGSISCNKRQLKMSTSPFRFEMWKGVCILIDIHSLFEIYSSDPITMVDTSRYKFSCLYFERLNHNGFWPRTFPYQQNLLKLGGLGFAIYSELPRRR